MLVSLLFVLKEKKSLKGIDKKNEKKKRNQSFPSLLKL
jgi:hypothetical protein